MALYRFPEPIRLINHKRGQYPFEMYCDFPALDDAGNVVLVVPGRWKSKEGYRTDLASIPTWALKNLLEPIKIIPTDSEDQTGPWLVYVYEEDEDGTLVLMGWFRDPIAYAAIVHDAGYSLEMERRVVVDGRFLAILTQGEVWSRWIMYSGVRVGGWTSYPHPMDEVTSDRILFAEARDRYSYYLNPAVSAG